MKHLKKVLAFLLVLAMAFSLAACSGKGGSGDARTITYWIPRGEDASYYPEYEDNPVIKYICENYTFNGKKLKIDFNTAPPGSEADDFSMLLATGDYSGVMDMSMANVTVAELYKDEMIWDLTELIPAHMPNYSKFLDENPQLKDTLYTYIDGEAKILSLRGFSDKMQESFQGFCYRRDWIVKYGTNPVTGEPFTGSFTDPNDEESWQDDVVFPNGTSEPLYISDWEWMFEIFTKAMEAEGITDGYCYSPYYAGYESTGDLYTAFGGGAPHWYLKDGKIVYGITDDNMRAYLQCMNTWYKNGWIDPKFEEHTGDMFFAVDTKTVFAGKVGLWQGRQSTVGRQLAGEDDLAKDILVFGCKQPINDIYGGEEQKSKTPNHMYQYARYNNAAVLTNKLSEEDVIAFLEFVDFLYTEEGAVLANVGLNAEQYKKTPSELYERLGITDGAYTVVEENGEKRYITKIDPATYDYGATNLNRSSLRLTMVSAVDKGYKGYLAQALNAWDSYESTANLPVSVQGAISPEQNQEISKITASLNQFLQRTVPTLIKGETYDVWSDEGWAEFCGAVNKYRANNITEIYQSILDSLK